MNTIKSSQDFSNYSSNYTRQGFWQTLRNSALRIGRRTTLYALLLFYTLESDEVTLKNKGIIIASLGYLIAPIDLIPDVIPVLGFTDDAAAIKIAYDTVKSSITPSIERKALAKLSQWFD